MLENSGIASEKRHMYFNIQIYYIAVNIKILNLWDKSRLLILDSYWSIVGKAALVFRPGFINTNMVRAKHSETLKTALSIKV